MDKDLQSIQEVRELVAAAKKAQLEFKHYNQEQVDKIVKAMADAGYAEAERLAKLAEEETGFGKWEDKVKKNEFGTKITYDSIKNLKSVGVIDVQSNGKVIKIAEPMGVVAALIPSTNPTSTIMFKAIISLKCRNAIVASPHPRAAKCSMEALKVLIKAAENAGAPKGLMQCMATPTIAGTDELMKNKDVAVILATGSNPMVKAAYSAGTPAYGVGSGNVPAFIDRTANVTKAVEDIISGKTFDNGTLCSSEQAVIVDRPVKDAVISEFERLGCYFVDETEKLKLEKAVVKGKGVNPEIVGKPAAFIADYAGFSVPENTKILLAHCDTIGHDEPLSIEKLSPVLAFYTVDGWLEGCHKCIDVLEFGGIGHTLVIHSNDREVIMKFALEKPAFRIVVNTPSSLGAVGYTTELIPSMTLGVGTWGGSIISENVSAKHLMNIKTLAFETKPMNEGYSVTSLDDGHISSKSTNEESGYLKQIEERLLARAGNPKIVPQSRTQPGDKESDSALGSGISINDVDKLIREFKR